MDVGLGLLGNSYLAFSDVFIFYPPYLIQWGDVGEIVTWNALDSYLTVQAAASVVNIWNRHNL